MSWSSLPNEIKERIICFIGDDRIYESIYTNRIRKTCRDIIDSEKKKNIARGELPLIFCRDVLKYFFIGKKALKIINFDFCVQLFKNLFSSNDTKLYFKYFLFVFPSLSRVERIEFAEAICEELQQIEEHIFRYMVFGIRCETLTDFYLQFENKNDLMKFFIYIDCLYYLTEDIFENFFIPFRKLDFVFTHKERQNSWHDFIELVIDFYECNTLCCCWRCKSVFKKVRKYLMQTSFFVQFFLYYF